MADGSERQIHGDLLYGDLFQRCEGPKLTVKEYLEILQKATPEERAKIFGTGTGCRNLPDFEELQFPPGKIKILY